MRRVRSGRVSTASGVGTPRWYAGPAGFTLIELLVVVLIVGILMTLGIPQYTKTIESSKADTAAALTKMIGQANRMYYLDKNKFVDGQIQDICNNSTTCDGSTGVCNLLACKYLPSQTWDNLDYTYFAGASKCPSAATEVVACAKRAASARTPYNTWAYTMDKNGAMKAVSGDAAKMPPAPPN